MCFPLTGPDQGPPETVFGRVSAGIFSRLRGVGPKDPWERGGRTISLLREDPGDPRRNPAGRTGPAERSGTPRHPGLPSGGLRSGSTLQQCPEENGVHRFRTEDQRSRSIGRKRSSRPPAGPAEIREGSCRFRAGRISDNSRPSGRPKQHHDRQSGTPETDQGRERPPQCRKITDPANGTTPSSPIAGNLSGKTEEKRSGTVTEESPPGKPSRGFSSPSYIFFFRKVFS